MLAPAPTSGPLTFEELALAAPNGGLPLEALRVLADGGLAPEAVELLFVGAERSNLVQRVPVAVR